MRLGELVQVAKVTELTGTALDSHPDQPFSERSAPAADGWVWGHPRGSGVGTLVLTLHCILLHFGASLSVHSPNH